MSEAVLETMAPNVCLSRVDVGIPQFFLGGCVVSEFGTEFPLDEDFEDEDQDNRRNG